MSDAIKVLHLCDKYLHIPNGINLKHEGDISHGVAPKADICGTQTKNVFKMSFRWKDVDTCLSNGKGRWRDGKRETESQVVCVLWFSAASESWWSNSTDKQSIKLTWTLCSPILQPLFCFFLFSILVVDSLCDSHFFFPLLFFVFFSHHSSTQA